MTRYWNGSCWKETSTNGPRPSRLHAILELIARDMPHVERRLTSSTTGAEVLEVRWKHRAIVVMWTPSDGFVGGDIGFESAMDGDPAFCTDDEGIATRSIVELLKDMEADVPPPSASVPPPTITTSVGTLAAGYPIAAHEHTVFAAPTIAPVAVETPPSLPTDAADETPPTSG